MPPHARAASDTPVQLPQQWFAKSAVPLLANGLARISRAAPRACARDTTALRRQPRLPARDAECAGSSPECSFRFPRLEQGCILFFARDIRPEIPPRELAGRN